MLNLDISKIVKKYDLKNIDQVSCEKMLEEINVLYCDHLEQEQAAKKQLEHLRLIVDTTPCTISWINRNLEYEGLNEKLREVIGISSEHFIGKKIGSHTENDFFNSFCRDLFASTEKTMCRELSSTYQGKVRYYWVIATKYNNDQEAVLIGMETTKLHEMQHQLMQNEKMVMLGEMSSGIAHEIKNPLMIAQGFVELLTKEIDRPMADIVKIKDRLTKTANALDRIGAIMNGLHNLSRNSSRDDFVPVDIQDVIKDAQMLCAEKIRKSGVMLSSNCNVENTCVNGRKAELLQVFINLFNNACDAIESLPEKWINVEILNENDLLRVNVIDSGKGIPQDVQEKMMQAFFTTKDLGKGTGLGLYISSLIMQNHGAKFSIDGQKSNTTFSMIFNR